MKQKTLRWMADNVWLGWLLCLPLLVFPVVWAFDRSPPFEVLSREPSSAKPGGHLMLVAEVRRDVKRGCSAFFTRHLYTPAGYRYDLEGLQFASASQIEDIEDRQPGRLALIIELPASITAGTAHLVTNLQYRCNPLHMLWPINITTDISFTVELP